MHQVSPAYIEMFQQGNPKILPLLIMLFYDELFKLSYRITRNKLETQEIIQDTFTVLWQNREGFKTYLSIRKFLFKVVKNKSLNSLKKSNSREKMLNDYAFISSEVTLIIDCDKKDSERLLIKLSREIEKLPPRPKLALSMIVLGKSIKEIAAVMGIKEASVRAIKQRGIAALRKKIRTFFTTW